MRKRDEKTIMVLRETVTESIITDTYTFGCLILVCMVGHWLEIPALEWIGGLMFVIGLMLRMVGGAYSNCYTIEEARTKLDEIEQSMKGEMGR